MSLLLVGIFALTRVASAQDGLSVGKPTPGYALNSLSSEERTWLREHPVITLAHDPGWPPIEFSDEHGGISGMAGDYVKLVEQRLGIQFTRVPNLSWQEAYARQKRWAIDMASCVAKTPQRTEFWAFTKPYMTVPIVIATQSNVTYIADIKQLFGKKVALVKGYAIDDWITKDYPEINLTRVKDPQEGLALLQRGEVFAYIDNLLIIGDYQAKMKVTNIKIAGQTPYVNAQCMAVRKDWAPLVGILDRALDSISETERMNIYSKWLPLRYEHHTDYTLLWEAMAVFAVILLVMILWNWRLAKEIVKRRSAEVALRQANLVVENSPVVLFRWRAAEGWPVAMVSHNVIQFGYTPQELLSGAVTFASLVHPDDLDRVVREVQEYSAGGMERFQQEYRIVTKDGGVRWVDDRTVMERNSDGQIAYYQGIVIDITDRKQAEEALSEKSQFIASLLHAIPVAVFYKDKEGRYLGCNDTFTEIMGVTADHIRGKTVHELWPSELAEKYHYMDLEIMRNREHQVYEFQVKAKDGQLHPVIYAKDVYLDKYGEVAGLVGAFLDITERKQVEVELARQITLFRNLFESSPEAIAVLDHGDRVMEVNHSFETLFGYSQTEARGCLINDLLAPEPYLDDALETSQTVIGAGRIMEKEAIRCTKDGRALHVSLVGYPIVLNGLQIGAYAIYRDITERIRMVEQLVQAQKMESVGRLAGGIAHDFNNMLSAILGHTELAMGKCSPSEPICDDLEVIEKAALRSADLTRQLLAFARRQTVEPKVLELNDVVAGMLKMLQRLIGEDIDFAWMPGAGIWPVKIDPSQIDQILANLCVNARDAIDGVGKITIETENITLDEPYCTVHPGFMCGQFVMLAVSDDGRGMDKEILGQIFEPFFTTKERGKGTGLGLATVYGVVKQNEGFINVYSEPGKGSTFKIYLPRFMGKFIEPPVESTKGTMRGRGETVLLVEDDEVILNLGRLMLENLGYVVLTAGTPSEALRIVTDHAGEIQLLITDVVMPEMNGRDLVKSINDIKSGLKCLYISGYTGNVIVHRGILDEGVHFLHKPFSMKELAYKVRGALEQG